MKNTRFVKNTLLLIIGGFLTKILGFIIKVLYTRYLKNEGVALITLVFPTYSLLLTISSFALPLAVTKLIAQRSIRKSKILFSSFWITSFINILLIVLTFIFSSYFASNFLHDYRCSYLIKIMCLTLPFVSVTSLIKAYFFGIENVVPIIISNVLEELFKLVMILLFLEKMIGYGIIYGTTFYLLINLLCEIISFIILFIFIPKKIKISKLSYKYDHKCASGLLKISVPTLAGKLVGSFGFFLEPIILTNLLLYKGLNKNSILLNYGAFQGYAIQILIIPSFFLMALSSNIVPTISKLKINKDYKRIKIFIFKLFKLIITCGIIYILILYFEGKNLMNLLYKTSSGYNYLKKLLPFFILFYLESPLLSVLQGLDKEKCVFKTTTFSLIIKYISLTIFILLGFGFNSLIYSEMINIIFVIFLSSYYLINYFSNPSQ